MNKDILITCCLKERAASDRPPPRMVVLCGPSGAGIGQLVEHVLNSYSEKFGRCVSHTTRPPMEHEVFGSTYNFVDEKEMTTLKEENQFLEHNTIEKYSKIFPGTYEYGTSLATVREIAAAGKLCITTLDLRGCQDLYNREGVDALYIFVNAPNLEELEKRLRGRLKEAESTVQKRIDYAVEEVKSVEEMGTDQSLFDHEIVTEAYESFFQEIKEAISPLSPIIRNRIRGLPPYLLDYSDVIPSNSVEKPVVKPVIIAGPDDEINDMVVDGLLKEFPDVFGIAERHTTNKELWKMEREKTESYKGYKFIPEADFDKLTESGSFVEHTTDLFAHESLRKKYGTTKEALDSVIAQNRLCLLRSSVKGTKMIRDSGLDALCIFLKPPDPETHHKRLRGYLAESEDSIQSMLKRASAIQEEATQMNIFDKFICNDELENAFGSLKDCISLYRPDIIAPEDQKNKDMKQEKAQAPLILCGPSGLEKDSLMKMLTENYAGKFEQSILYTSRTLTTAESSNDKLSFLDSETMKNHVESGFFLEHIQEDDIYYGTSLKEVEDASFKGKMCIIDVDISRAEMIKETGNFQDALYVYVEPPSSDILEERLKKEGIKDQAIIKKKVELAAESVEKAKENTLFEAYIKNTDEKRAGMELTYFISKHSPTIIEPRVRPFVICGPLGCGKHELITNLFKSFPGKFAVPVIHTTRGKLNNSRDNGYAFLSEEEFDSQVESGKILYYEKALECKYGLSIDSVEEICMKEIIPIIDIDTVSHAQSIKAAQLKAIFLFIGPSDMEDIEKHLREELTKSQPPGYSVEEALGMRLSFIKKECKAAAESENLFEYTINVSSKEILSMEVDAEEQVGNISYHRLLEAVSIHVPAQIPSHQVWGYGQPFWDPSVREYGKMQLKVIILGPAGSGKTTQCNLLSKKFRIPIISPGLLMYDEVMNNTEIGLAAKVFLDSSKNIPEDLLVRVISKRISRSDCQAQGWILDGFPHTTAEAQALSDAGIEADKVIFLQSRQDVLLWRSKGRRIDPSNAHDIYFVPPTAESPPEILGPGKTSKGLEPIVPMGSNGKPDDEIMNRLTIRHDDTEENFRNRIQVYDKYEAGIKAEYHLVSQYFPDGRGELSTAKEHLSLHGLSPGELFDAIVDFLHLEERRAESIEEIDSKTLAEFQYTIADAIKFQKKCLVLLMQQTGPFVGKKFWVDLNDLCSNTLCLNVNHNTAVQSHTLSFSSKDSLSRGSTYLMHVESEEPIRLIATLSLAPQYALKDSPDVCEPRKIPPLVFCGPSGVGKSTIIDMLVDKYAEKFSFLLRDTSGTGNCFFGILTILLTPSFRLSRNYPLLCQQWYIQREH